MSVLGISKNPIAFWRQDPIAFVKQCFKAKPTSQQEEGLLAVRDHKRVTIRSGHGTGKDALASWLIWWFFITRPHPRVLCTAPTFRQLKDVLWGEVAKWGRRAPFFDEFAIRKDIIYLKKHPNTWWCRAVSINVKGSPDEQAEALQGYHDEHLLIIGDEASGIPDPVFKPVEGMLTKEDNKILLIGNPTRARGYFYDTHSDPALASLWKRLHWDSSKSPNVSPEWLRMYKLKYGEDHPIYQVRVAGNFPLGGDETLIPLGWVEQCVDCGLKPTEGDPVVFGVDVARFGIDMTALTIVHGPKVYAPKTIGRMDTIAVGEWVMDHASKWNPQAILFDVSGGLGAGPADYCRRYLADKIIDVNVAWAAPHGDRFRILRDELWWRARIACERIQWNLPYDQELIDELATPTYKQNDRTGKIEVESKRQLKARGFGSPDKADSLILTRYFNMLHHQSVVPSRALGWRRKRPLNWKLI